MGGTPAGRIVVVGQGIAGLTACHALRGAGFDGELTLVGEEAHAPYSRPALSKAMLAADETDLTSLALPAPTHGATEILGVRATGLDVGRRVVTLDDGTGLAYDRLVIATGSRARRLSGSGPGDRVPGELTLRSLDDALALRRRLAGTPSVVVVGGGPLGMEIASGALAAGCAVTLVADVPPLAAHLGAYLSGVLVSAAVARGLRLVITGTAVRLADQSGTPVVVTPDGRRFRADLVVTAAGDIPNVEWLAGTGLLRDGRLEADRRGRVRDDIVAVGDVAAIPTRQGVRRVPFWTSAIEQAKGAASALLIGDEAPELDYRPYFWTEQFGLSLKACGELPPAGDPEFVEGSDPRGPAVLRWAAPDGPGTGTGAGAGAAVAVNHRIPVPRLRRLAAAGPALSRT